ncbi:inadl protein [Roseibium sp.]|uniref:inadl protein n=1 Tax=Roseibium sp. TaxID=1936156 RepID=UPI003B522808
MIRNVFVALIALVLFPLPAFAQTTVDFSPVIEQVIGGVFSVVGVAAVWLLNKALDAFKERTGIELDDQYARRLDGALWNAINYGQVKAQETLAKHGKIDIRNELLANAINYAMESVPDALKHFDISQDRLLDMLEARLGMDLDGDGAIGGEPDKNPNVQLVS